MKYIIYLTTNLKSQINGINRIYIGVHQTNDPSIFDGYIGCGVNIYKPSTYMYPKTAFQHAVKKYGVKSFKRDILYIYDTKEEAYQKEAELVTTDFINQPHTYNMIIGGIYKIDKKLYQFDLQGNLIKEWDSVIEAAEFYGYPFTRFKGPKRNKCIFLDSFWSHEKIIDVTEYSIKPKNTITYLYTKEGKLINEFFSLNDCSKFLNYDCGELSRAVKNQTLIRKQYFVSYNLEDQFIIKPRRQYINKTFYVYNKDNDFIGTYKGKELMKVINLHSWDYINHIFTHNNNWYKDYYITFEPINCVPNKKFKNGFIIDIYTKTGDFIETLHSAKEVKEKYNIPSSKLKNIQYGNKYYGDYIFKYNSK